ncbi:glucose dehydrogenase [FAD, quinone]-like [Bacillus rossius redtenbacheri]|uniref:glucose dehydrogenase [FAD, quinone]-like n=1 Tax=Bacillus rossius redtenbacheri TaxID=93214 RepID=UPI002FDD47BB
MEASCSFQDTEFLSGTCGANYSTFMTLVSLIIGSTKNISDPCRRLGRDGSEMPEVSTFDYVVVGSGPAGSVVASRLSEVPSWSVLLLEAGPEEPSATLVPSFFMSGAGTKLDWNYKTQPHENAFRSTNGVATWPRGKVVGGTIILEGNMYTRGHKNLYNRWEAEGNVGWGYDDLLPYFKKGESIQTSDVEKKYHGTEGPVSVGHFPYQPKLSKVIIEAAKERGLPHRDLTGSNQTGVSVALVMVKDGLRASPPRVYLRPNKARGNLRVSMNSHVTKVLIDSKTNTAHGVQFIDSKGVTKTALARKEVILSAGAIGSPQLLLLSGVGPAEDLKELGIDVKKDLPVGKNLHNHVSVTVSFTINDTATQDLTQDAVLQFINNRTGPLSSDGLTQVTFFKKTSYAEDDIPDIQGFFDGYSAACSRTGVAGECSDGSIGQTCGRRKLDSRPTNIYPRSRGYLKLNSTDPFDYPLIYGNYFSNETDVQVIIEGIKFILDMANTSALAAWDIRLDTTPVAGCKNLTFGSDKYWECVIRTNTNAENHQGGSCKMGPANDTSAVVDPELRVHGISRLRVVDASICPMVPNSNLTPFILAAAEKLADMIKKEALTDYLK